MGIVSNTHLKAAHAMTPAQYRLQFPGSPMVNATDMKRRAAESVLMEPWVRKKASDGHIGRPSANRGRHFSAEQKKQMSEISTAWWKRPENVGKKFTELHKARIADAQRGKSPTPEVRAKISATLKGRKRTPESVMKTAAGNCGKKHTEEARERHRAARLLQVFPKRDTSIERAVQEELKARDVPFRTHVPLLGQPDIFIEPNICIFCDGDYWHSRPERRSRDDYVSRHLGQNNFVVMRFGEGEIMSNASMCVDSVMEVMMNESEIRGVGL